MYDHSEALRLNGQVVWGHIIQANEQLYEPDDSSNCPAAIVYSIDAYYLAHPEELGDIASMLFDLKGTQTNPELQQFSDLLANERETQMYLPIPESLTGGRRVIYTSIMVHRHHLPTNFLSSSLFPLLVAPQQTDATSSYPIHSGVKQPCTWLAMSDLE